MHDDFGVCEKPSQLREQVPGFIPIDELAKTGDTHISVNAKLLIALKYRQQAKYSGPKMERMIRP